ncbi:DUF2785 domain-containing protein [Ornithinibacillus bavariensis]|uniref:DUF2785 domain-containing protein n=1 Tax=Ornithinibacillus bavariensis TaxID=545502 RepID=UPI000EE207E9|nr:hypothetical protein [Ornithinibacillus sp.]
MNGNELKNILTEFKNTDFQSIGTVDLGVLTNAMLTHIGSTDPELRDSLIYPSFAHLIINGRYTRPNLNQLMKICLDDNHLFFKVDEVGEDAVFTRSFSSLIIAVLLHVNVKNSFLTDDEVDEVAVKLLEYVKQEEDVRGFVEEKGWAHSIAHIADALDELAKQPQLEEARLKEIALSILGKMYFDKDYLLFEEDERMVVPMVTILDRGIDQSILYDKIDKITKELQQNYSKNMKTLYMQRTNIKQFLKSLVLHLEVLDKHERLRIYLKQALKTINQPYYNI